MAWLKTSGALEIFLTIPSNAFNAACTALTPDILVAQVVSLIEPGRIFKSLILSECSMVAVVNVLTN